MEKQKPEAGVWIFYVIILVVIFIQAGIVEVFGLWGGGAIFLFGGIILGLIELKLTRLDDEVRDPVMRLGLWLVRKNAVIGFLIMALLLGGAPGTAVLFTKYQSPHRLQLTLVAAVLFALVWAPSYHYLLP